MLKWEQKLSLFSEANLKLLLFLGLLWFHQFCFFTHILAQLFPHQSISSHPARVGSSVVEIQLILRVCVD